MSTFRLCTVSLIHFQARFFLSRSSRSAIPDAVRQEAMHSLGMSPVIAGYSETNHAVSHTCVDRQSLSHACLQTEEYQGKTHACVGRTQKPSIRKSPSWDLLQEVNGAESHITVHKTNMDTVI